MALGKYISEIFAVGKSVGIGMGITMKYFLESLILRKHTSTIQYPRERDVIPERHRGIHFLETEKCVMCWKCSDICPVDCIYIEGVRGADGVLADGYRGSKATLSKFTVDYTVCIFCGLCEEPCPTQCIHLGPEYDYHATDRTMMEKNLLTDRIYTQEDEKFVRWAREENERLKAEKAKAAAAAKAAGAAKPASVTEKATGTKTAPAPKTALAPKTDSAAKTEGEEQ